MTDALADSSAVTPAVTSSTGGTPASSAKRPTPSPAGGTAKKRPYRRTKRPKNYCDKSTVTTTTPTLANQPVNVYDAVLGECEDLLRASLEAQRLGRLKMASAYQLLLHTRLVGLGKRFDQASIMPPLRKSKSTNETNEEEDEENEGEEEEDYEDDDNDDGDDQEEKLGQGSEDVNPRARAARGGGLKMDDAASVPPATSSKPRKNGASAAPSKVKVSNFPIALEKLSEILPSNLEMDTSMMEHLARAAVELHHQRTGRKKSADGLLASPVTGFIGTSPAAVVSSSDSKPSASGAAGNKRDNTKIAWTPEEQQIVEKAVAEKKAPYAIAKLLKNKTEAQVKAFLKNQAKTSEQTDALADDLESPSKKRGGRGRKPPTTAVNTVPNANLDAKSLLQGILKRG